LLTAALVDYRVVAVVALVPGNVVLCGWPPGKPAWTSGGDAAALGWLLRPEFAAPRLTSRSRTFPDGCCWSAAGWTGSGHQRPWRAPFLGAGSVTARTAMSCCNIPTLETSWRFSDPRTWPAPPHRGGVMGPRVIITDIDRIGTRRTGEPARQFIGLDHRADAWHHLLSFLASLSERSAA
jgi:hypothetical protein